MGEGGGLVLLERLASRRRSCGGETGAVRQRERTAPGHVRPHGAEGEMRFSGGQDGEQTGGAPPSAAPHLCDDHRVSLDSPVLDEGHYGQQLLFIETLKAR